MKSYGYEERQRILLGIEEMISTAIYMGQSMVVVPWYNNEICSEVMKRYPNVFKSHRQFMRSGGSRKLQTLNLMMIVLDNNTLED